MFADSRDFSGGEQKKLFWAASEAADFVTAVQRVSALKQHSDRHAHTSAVTTRERKNITLAC